MIPSKNDEAKKSKRHFTTQHTMFMHDELSKKEITFFLLFFSCFVHVCHRCVNVYVKEFLSQRFCFFLALVSSSLVHRVRIFSAIEFSIRTKCLFSVECTKEKWQNVKVQFLAIHFSNPNPIQISDSLIFVHSTSFMRLSRMI